MQIDRSNYEIWFLDYIDGNLSVDFIDDFLEFLKRNPDLKEELQSVMQAPVSLPDEKITFDRKKDLLRNELTGITGFDYRAIAWMEGDLTEEEKVRFDRELQDDPQKREDFSLIKSLRLQPQTNISFPDKGKLLKNDSRRSLFLWSGRIAAILILGLLIWALFPADQQTSPRQAAPVASVNRQSSVSQQQQVPSQAEEKQQPPVVSKQVTAKAGIPQPSATTQPDQGKKNRQEETLILSEEHESMTPLQPLKAVSIPIQTAKVMQLPQYAHEPREEVEYTKLTDYLAQKLLDIPPGEQLTLAGLARAGLQAAENISNNKLSIKTSDEGKIAEINFNSLLFGFSIPVKKNK